MNADGDGTDEEGAEMVCGAFATAFAARAAPKVRWLMIGWDDWFDWFPLTDRILSYPQLPPEARAVGLPPDSADEAEGGGRLLLASSAADASSDWASERGEAEGEEDEEDDGGGPGCGDSDDADAMPAGVGEEEEHEIEEVEEEEEEEQDAERAAADAATAAAASSSDVVRVIASLRFVDAGGGVGLFTHSTLYTNQTTTKQTHNSRPSSPAMGWPSPAGRSWSRWSLGPARCPPVRRLPRR